MNHLYRVLPPLAPDYAGACAVMYELGGLVLIHDASGCTVNYVSFDEPRWHEKPGMVYCSGLTEIDAVMGNDDVLIDKALKAAEELHPAFIAYVGSSVPLIVGTDFNGIAAETEARSGIPCFGFECSGIRSYIEGASNALLALTRRFCGEKTESRGTLLLGQLPLDDNGTDASAQVKDLFPDLRASLCFDCTLDDLKQAQNAEKAVVVSAAGLKTVQYLQERYGIPYTVGLPLPAVQKPHGSVLVIGEDVRAQSLAKALGNADALDLYGTSGLCRYHTREEEEIMRIAAGYDNVIADPCFKSLCQGNFISLPSYSVSGGLFASTVSPVDPEAIAELLK